MTRELTLELETAPLERAPADVAVVPLFAGERPLRGAASRVDWRLCGKLSSLVACGRLRGDPGEATLVATFGGMRVRLLLVLGVGERAGFDARRYELLAGDAVRRGLALRAGSLAFPFPDDPGGAVALERRAVALLTGAAAALAAAEAPVALRMRLLVGREEAARTADLMRRARPPRFPQSVALHLPRPVPARAGRGAPAPPRGTQLVK
jgi:hypothetical protein